MESEKKVSSKLGMFKSQKRNDTRSTLFELVEPLGDLDLALDNETYERYDAEDTFIADFISKAKKVLR